MFKREFDRHGGNNLFSPSTMTLSRRHFLCSAVAVPLTLPLLSRFSIADEASVKFQLGLASYTFRKFSRAETIAAAKKIGLNHLCLKDFHLPLSATDEECAVAAAECRAAGITLYGCGVVGMNKPEDVENAFRYAKAAGMTTIIGVPKPELLPLVEEKVKATNIAVAIHNHGPGDKVYPTPESIYEKVKDFDKRIGICNDIGHTERYGVDGVESILKYGHRTLDMHFRDITEKTEKGQCCVCGKGVLDLAGYVNALKEIGYDRIVSFEYEADESDPLPGLTKSVEYIRKLIGHNS